VDRRAIWARNFRRFGVIEDTSQRSTPHRLQQARFSSVARIIGGEYVVAACWNQARGVGVDGQQPVEPGLAVLGQNRAEPSVGFLQGPLSGGSDDAFQMGDARPLDPEAEQMFAGQAQQQGGAVVLQGAVHEPAFELGQVTGRGLAEAEVTPDQPEVLRPCLTPSAITRQLARGDVNLLRHEGDDRLGGSAQVVGAEAQEAERAEL
jgi:hypothetical protein